MATADQIKMLVKAHIHTPEQSIDLYTPILTKIKVSTPISVNKY
ncbi:hypothetical protein [Paenibacillus sp. FSL L8-0638]